MADVRINALATTAATSASDDYLAVDGTTNATRKLSAYSPSFGGNLAAATVTTSGAATLNSVVTSTITGSPTISGNLTVSGTGTHTFGGPVQVTNANDGIGFVLKSNTAVGSKGGIYWQKNTGTEIWRILADPNANNGDELLIRSAAGVEALKFAYATGAATFDGNLTVNGTGASSVGGTFATGAPTGGAGAWKLGIANAVSPTSPNRTITVDIGGTLYYIHAKTTND